MFELGLFLTKYVTFPIVLIFLIGYIIYRIRIKG